MLSEKRTLTTLDVSIERIMGALCACKVAVLAANISVPCVRVSGVDCGLSPSQLFALWGGKTQTKRLKLLSYKWRILKPLIFPWLIPNSARWLPAIRVRRTDRWNGGLQPTCVILHSFYYHFGSTPVNTRSFAAGCNGSELIRRVVFVLNCKFYGRFANEDLE